MTVSGLRIRHLTFLGPAREPATISFGPGLNVVYGASNTGKSFIVDTIDFMLGGKGPIRDIPEREGYDRIVLGMEMIGAEAFTLVRSTDGGSFRAYPGLHIHKLPAVKDSIELNEAHNDRRDDNLSAFLLAKVNLAHKRIRKNKRKETQSLSFRNLARLVIINEEEIIQKRSPLSDGNYSADTSNTSVFKLLLTGVDDSALTAGPPASPEVHSREGQLELLDLLITDMKRRIRDLAGAPAELELQLGRLDESMAQRGQQLVASEDEYRTAAGKRRDLLKRYEEGSNRLTEINNLVERFGLLDQHYDSDLERLTGIAEAGSLFSVLGDRSCPLCGSLAEHHRLKEDCDGNVDAVVTAARSEATKITLRRTELISTLDGLKKEGKSFERRLPKLQDELRSLSQQIDGIISPKLRQLRTTYGQLADKKGEVREALGFHTTLKDLEDRKLKLLSEIQIEESASDAADVGLSTSAVDKFSSEVLAILKAWRFPSADRVHFDLKTKDLVINGKNRVSFGKGLRAITQSAFTVGLLQFCRLHAIPHPGFIVLDSPLLSYREPESPEDDLSGTDLNAHFYDYLSKLPDDRQFIVIENTDPPASVQKSAQAIKFTGVVGVERFGYFPPPGDTAASLS